MPFDVALDSDLNIYLTDTFNHRVRRINREAGIITTVVGNGKPGFSGDGVPAVQAQLNEPYGRMLDGSCNLFVADRLNRRIRRVDARTGAISAVAGNGTAVYSGYGRLATLAGLVEPNGVSVSPVSRILYIGDVAGNRIRRVDLASALIRTFAGSGRPRHAGDGGPADRASLRGARAIDLAKDGSVCILERQGNSLRIVDSATNTIQTIAGTRSKGFTGNGGPCLFASFNGPEELDVDSFGNIRIVDPEHPAIRLFDAATRTIRIAAGTSQAGRLGVGGSATEAQLDRPHGIAVASEGSSWIADSNNHRIRLVSFDR
jgi:DNA-binding beta-propeller fold protein YncE